MMGDLPRALEDYGWWGWGGSAYVQKRGDHKILQSGEERGGKRQHEAVEGQGHSSWQWADNSGTGQAGRLPQQWDRTALPG